MCYEKRDTEQARACFERDQRKDDYISRKALLAEYDRVHVGPTGGARKLIEEAPAVDVVPVVRCVNCVHFGSEVVAFDAFTPFCLKHRVSVFPDDFCSYGERKEADGNG